MKKCVAFAGSFLLLLSMAGCSNTDEQIPLEPIPVPIELSVSDLNDILAALDLSEATLSYHGKVDNICDASSAIRADNYIENLQRFTWEEYLPPDGWDGSYEYRCVLTTPSVTLTAYRGNSEATRLLRVTTDNGEGMFTLPYITDKDSGNAIQMNWMIFDTFKQWYDEAHTASLNRETGTPLTAEELDWFTDYTTTEQVYYDEPQDSNHIYSTEISCFFTSYYEDVAELDFEEWMRYFPGDGSGNSVTEEEFEALKNVGVWPFKEFESFDSMPVPIHKYFRSTVDAALTKYAGITTADLDTSSVAYLAEYDSFYTYTSDFGPGWFIPCYGERNGDTVTLWEAPAGDNMVSDTLVLQKNSGNWHILSHQPATIS